MKGVRRAVDGAMTVLLPLLMGELLLGQEVHKWMGATMLVLFLAHHLLNLAWWKNLFRGAYTPARALGTGLNLLLLADMVALGVSGIWMSGFVFAFLPRFGGLVLARRLHLFASFWGLLLMSAHLGLHADAMLAAIRRRFPEGETGWRLPLRLFSLALCLYGLYAFFAQRIPDYLFLRAAFLAFDESKPAPVFFSETIAMVWLFATLAYLLRGALRKAGHRQARASLKNLWKGASFAVPVLVCVAAVFLIHAPASPPSWSGAASGSSSGAVSGGNAASSAGSGVSSGSSTTAGTGSGSASQAPDSSASPEDGLVLLPGGTFIMGSPEDEPWRSADETAHTVTVSDFYLSPYEVSQRDYEALMGANPSSFTGEDLPVENVSWLDAVAYCNARSEQEGLTPAYTVDGETVSWDRSANGYRLPTEAEWEYACRAGTATPFNTETSISPEEADYYGTYPYEIENNYFSQENLSTRPGQYRQTTVAVDSFSPNPWGLWNMHGNVSEWVWDLYGTYGADGATDPAGPETGTRRVYRGGGWNDFAKNLRSAYRAALPQESASFNLGFRLARNAAPGAGTSVTTGAEQAPTGGGKVLIAFFSWGGNTRGIAQEIQSQTGADLFEILPDPPCSTDYNTVLDEAQRDQNRQARPTLLEHVNNFDQYDTILLGYPNWWASIPMPIASFLEEYDFSGKTIVPFCSHGGGRFGQSLTAIAKLAPDAILGEPLSVHYSGGSDLPENIAAWLETNGIPQSGR